MEPPFPGMDPYLERPSRWPDVHAGFIAAMRDYIQRQLNPRYAAIITPYVAFEDIEIASVRMAIPDVALIQQETPFTAESGVTTTAIPVPLTLPALMQVATRYARIDIRTVEDETLVTAIELLSPANKRPGSNGADAYEQKRQEIFRSSAHLLEIDLLRAGRRPKLARPLPDAPYFIFLSRAYRRPHIDIWPLSLRASIPPVPVPLRHPDPDVTLDMTQVIRQVYSNARYDQRTDYQANPPPPELAPDDAIWLDAHLRTCGLR